MLIVKYIIEPRVRYGTVPSSRTRNFKTKGELHNTHWYNISLILPVHSQTEEPWN